MYTTLFAADNVISQIRQGIVIQNVQLKDEDEELFKMNHVEFVRNDTEGSDLDMRRRRIVCELLKGIVMNYKGDCYCFSTDPKYARLLCYKPSRELEG